MALLPPLFPALTLALPIPVIQVDNPNQCDNPKHSNGSQPE